MVWTLRFGESPDHEEVGIVHRLASRLQTILPRLGRLECGDVGWQLKEFAIWKPKVDALSLFNGLNHPIELTLSHHLVPSVDPASPNQHNLPKIFLNVTQNFQTPYFFTIRTSKIENRHSLDWLEPFERFATGTTVVE